MNYSIIERRCFFALEEVLWRFICTARLLGWFWYWSSRFSQCCFSWWGFSTVCTACLTGFRVCISIFASSGACDICVWGWLIRDEETLRWRLRNDRWLVVRAFIAAWKGCESKQCGAFVDCCDGEFCFALVSVSERFDRNDVVLLFGVGMVLQNVGLDVNKQDRKQTS